MKQRFEIQILGFVMGVALTAGTYELFAAEIRIWKFEATVVSLDDPEELFDDVRLGDTVRGDFAYNVEMVPSFSDVGEDHYDSPFGFHAIRMAIENPRTEESLHYVLKSETSLFAIVTTDESDYGDSNVLLWQFGAEPPHPDLWSIPFIQFSGENVLTETSLPTAFDLDEWLVAAVFLGAEGINDGITASIFTLTPVAPGDFDQDGDVDEHDLDQWQLDYNQSGRSDADRDGDSDGMDFLAWQRQLGVSALATAVPEPSTGIALVLGMAILLSDRWTAISKISLT